MHPVILHTERRTKMTIEDKPHVGGFWHDSDPATYFPVLWEHVVKEYGIKTVIDVGCGAGWSSLFFKNLGCEVVAIDGSLVAQNVNKVPECFVFNDYELGSAPIQGEFDLCWSCEFVEHVYEKYSDNFLKDFQRARYLLITYARIGQGGHHHVNENTQEYWINRLNDYGFDFLQTETDNFRGIAEKENQNPYNHFKHKGLFFKRRIL